MPTTKHNKTPLDFLIFPSKQLTSKPCGVLCKCWLTANNEGAWSRWRCATQTDSDWGWRNSACPLVISCTGLSHRTYISYDCPISPHFTPTTSWCFLTLFYPFYPPPYQDLFTLQQSNMALGHPIFIDDLPSISQLSNLHLYVFSSINNLPVVPHKAVAEVSKIGNL